MSDKQSGKRLKEGVKLKTRKGISPKPAMVEKKRKIKTSKSKKRPVTGVEDPNKIKRKNIILSSIFTVLLIAVIIELYVYEYILLPFSDFAMLIIEPVILTALILAILFSFETYKTEFTPTILRILLTIGTLIVFFPITLYKRHTRHNVWRIFFTGFTIVTLLMSFFSPYIGLFGKRRSLIGGPGEDLYDVDTSALSAEFNINININASELKDFLDQLLNNASLLDQVTLESSVANVTLAGEDIGNYLYRYEVYDEYEDEDWEFVASSNALTTRIPENQKGSPEAENQTKLGISQTVYSATSSLETSLLSTWSSYYLPHIDIPQNLDANLLDLNGTQKAKKGSTDISYNTRDEFVLSSTISTNDMFSPFQGTYYYETHFIGDQDYEPIISNALDFDYYSTSIQNTIINDYALFLQTPDDYENRSPYVKTFADEIETLLTEDATVYQAITSVINRVLMKGEPTSKSEEGDGANNLAAPDGEGSFTDYIALTVMALRLLGIPARPVLGFAIGEPDSNDDGDYQALKIKHMYMWVEALVPYDDGGDIKYIWGQFQVGPYVTSNYEYVYCDNTMYSSYDIALTIYENSPGDVQTQNIEGQDVYLLDYGINYTVQATTTQGNESVEGTMLTFESFTTSTVENTQDPTTLIGNGVEIGVGSARSDSSGHAIVYHVFNSSFETLNLADPSSTSYVIFAYTGLSYDVAPIAIFPKGYLTDVSFNASKQSLPDPNNPLETYDYYLIQKDWRYSMSTFVYEDETETTPLTNRSITFYLLTSNELQQVQAGTLTDFSQLNSIGSTLTDNQGNATITNFHEGSDAFGDLSINTGYAVAASYGANYSASPIIYLDALQSIININTTSYSYGSPGYFFQDITVTLQMAPPDGTVEPLPDVDVKLWMIPLEFYEEYGTSSFETADEYISYLKGLDQWNINNFVNGTTNEFGVFNHIYQTNFDDYGVGNFKIVTFYKDRWNGSETISISSGPASFSINESEEVDPIQSSDSKVLNDRYQSKSLQMSKCFVKVQLSTYILTSTLVTYSFGIWRKDGEKAINKSILKTKPAIKRGYQR